MTLKARQSDFGDSCLIFPPYGSHFSPCLFLFLWGLGTVVFGFDCVALFVWFMWLLFLFCVDCFLC